MAYNKQARLDNKLSRLANEERYGNLSTSDATPTYLKLLAEGANAFSAMDTGESVFHHWASSGNAACLEAAVKTIDPRRIDDIGEHSKETPVARAVGMRNFDCAKILIEAGADITRWDRNGNTVLHTLAADDRGADCIRAALRNKPERVDVTNYSGDTALMKAANRGTMDCLNVLLEGGAAVDHQDKRGRSALMLAAIGRQPVSMNRLLEAGADMTLRDEDVKDAMAHCERWEEGKERLLAEPARRAEKRAAELDQKLNQACDSWAPPLSPSSTIKTRQAQPDTLTQAEHQAPVSRSRQRF